MYVYKCIRLYSLYTNRHMYVHVCTCIYVHVHVHYYTILCIYNIILKTETEIFQTHSYNGERSLLPRVFTLKYYCT